MLLAALLSLAVILCGLDHRGLMMSATGHTETAAQGCAGDTCATLIAKDIVSPLKATGILLLTFLLVFRFPNLLSRSPFPSLNYLRPDGIHPKTSNKHYRLHSVFLL